jgi:hypothetical protein
MDTDLSTGEVRTRVEAKVKKIEKELDYADRVYYNQYFYKVSEDDSCHLIVPSREAMHVFDNTGNNRLTYLGSDLSRKYKDLYSN